ncbi:MAG: exonuclease SbcCD subunit D C-terminal domain-containing protein [Chthoniobacteraceae bacterium]
MLRLFHTADWHLGQSFHGYDRDHEHGCFLEWLLGMLVERRPDALLIAGDIFDTVNPSATAQRRYYDFLARAHAALPQLQIVITAGNHDAASRLEAPASLLQSLGITAVGTVARDAEGAIDLRKFLVALKDASGTVRALALAIPFLRPADVPQLADAADPYLDGIRELYHRATRAAEELRDREYSLAALIALGHCHMQDATESRDSERRIVIGGAEALLVETFPASLAYVALGHLHRPQELAGGRIRYSGSPLPLSFSEKDYAHRVLEVVLDDTGRATASPLLVPKTATLQSLPAGAAQPIAKVLAALAAAEFDARLPAEAHPFLEVRVLDDGPDPTRRRRIEEALAGKPVRLASIKLESPARSAGGVEDPAVLRPTLADLSALDPEQIVIAAHRERYKTEPDPALLSALREILTAEPHLVSDLG